MASLKDKKKSFGCLMKMEEVCFGVAAVNGRPFLDSWEEVSELHVCMNFPGAQCIFGKRPLNLLPSNNKSTSAADLFS